MDSQQDYCDLLSTAFDGLSIVGLRFRPTDHELISHYLFNKLHGFPYFERDVFEFDLYGATEPWQIWSSFGGVDDEDLYFFTKLKRSTTKSGSLSAHVNRKVGLADGTWSGEGAPIPVFATDDETEKIIGYYKRLRYENLKLPEHHAEWIMHEYSLHESLLPPNATNNDYVLCRIRKNDRPKKKSGKKRCFSEMESVETIVPHEMINSNVQTQPETTIAREMINSYLQPEQRILALEMPINEGINEWAYLPRMTTIDGTSNVHEMTTNDGTSHVPEMTTINNTSEVPYVPEMTTNEGTSDVPYVPEMMTTNDGTIDETWRNLLDFSGMDDFVMDYDQLFEGDRS